MRHAALLALAFLALSARSLRASARHTFPIFDEIIYLELARDFALKGAAGTVACYLRGECREDNRHPLHPMILSTIMSGEPKDFARGKLLSLALAIILILTVYFATRLLWTPETAVAASIWLAWCSSLAYVSHFILADALFAALFFSACAVLARAERDPRMWLVFGALAGTAYLAKGNGHLLLAGGLAFGLWSDPKRFLLGRLPYVALAGFAAAAGFLLTRNFRVFGEFFYNVHERIIWLDSWNQYWVLSSSPSWTEVGLDWYLKRHSALDIVSRLASGARLVFVELLATLAPFARSWPTMALAAGFSAAGIAASWRGRRRECAAFLIPCGLMFWAFAWTAQPMAPDRRYLLPIAACLAPFAASSVLAQARRLKKPLQSRALAAAAISGSLFILLFASPGLTVDPRSLWSVPASWEKTSEFLCAHASGGYLISPTSFYSNWHRCKDGRRPFPLSAPAEVVRERALASPAAFVVLDQGAFGRGDIPETLGPRDGFGPRTFLGWRRCFTDGVKPAEILVYSPHCPIDIISACEL